MKNVKMKIIVLLLLCFTSALNFSAMAQTVGVKSGDYVNYSVSTTSMGQSGSSSMRVTVSNVSGTTISGTVVISQGQYSISSGFWIDVATGMHIHGAAPDTLIIPANLAQGQSIPGMTGVSITVVTDRSYLGTLRRCVGTTTDIPGVGITGSFYWDQSTGVLLEVSGSGTYQGQPASYALTVTETNMWTMMPSPTVGVEAGDWIRYEISYTGTPPITSPQWVKLEILNVAGTTVTARMTMHMLDGTETNQTGTIGVVSGSGTIPETIPGLVIPTNSKTGDSINMGMTSSTTIAGETTRTYAGASRTVVYASLSLIGSQITYYWDKQTGVVVETYSTSSGYTSTARATETNMWTTTPNPTVGVKSGDWIKYNITITGTPPTTQPQWVRLEILNVAGTTVTVRMTMHMLDGTETNQTGTIDVVSGSGTMSGLVIPANSKTGDSINMGMMDSTTIAGEITRTCAGASRTVVYANFSQFQQTYYWDKQTGILVEAYGNYGNYTTTGKATDTNMLGGGAGLFDGLEWWLWVIIIIAVVGVITAVAIVLILRRRKPPDALLPSQAPPQLPSPQPPPPP